MPLPEKARAYQAEFAARVVALPPTLKPSDLLWLRGRAANALREIGRFREAEAMRQRALEVVGAPGADVRYWPDFLAALKKVIARRDSSVAPLDMIDDTDVAFACVDLGESGAAFERAICAEPRRAAQIGQVRDMRERMKNHRPPVM